MSMIKNAMPLLSVIAWGLCHSSNAFAASAQVHGQAAIVGDFSTNLPPFSSTYQGWRVPLGLTLEARASNNLSLFLDLRYGDNAFPAAGRNLGNKQSLNISEKQKGSEVVQPFSYEGTSGTSRDTIHVGFAYLQYASDVGLFKVGRMPRNWGLGIWRNAEWKPEGGAISTSDAISATFDITSSFSGSLYWEKISEGQPTSLEDDADGFTVEALLVDDPSDQSSSGVSRKIGIAFNNYDHKQSSTKIKTLDAFAKINTDHFGIEGEILYPSGSTRSLSYQSNGGPSTQCATTPGSQPKTENILNISCDSQKIEGFSALLRTRYQFGSPAGQGEKSLNISQVESVRSRQATNMRPETHTASLWYGYARGDSDAFTGIADAQKDDSLKVLAMHPNMRPALLMNSASANFVPGMPGPLVQNETFLRADYTYEAPNFGTITPAVIWGRINSLNTKADLETSVGKTANLGMEFDIKYGFQTTDNLNLSLEGGFWWPGKAWQSRANSKQDPVYGIKTTASTQF